MAELATIARPYADAVFRVANEKGQLQPWAELLNKLAIIAQAQELVDLSKDPKLSKEQMIDLLLSLIGAQTLDADAVRRFLLELISHTRLQVLPEIAKQYQVLCDAIKDVAEVKITSAYALSDAQLEELLPALEKRFGKKLKPQVYLDETLIGGICAVVGDDTLDMSVKARLEQMKSALVA